MQVPDILILNCYLKERTAKKLVDNKSNQNTSAWMNLPELKYCIYRFSSGRKVLDKNTEFSDENYELL